MTRVQLHGKGGCTCLHMPGNEPHAALLKNNRKRQNTSPLMSCLRKTCRRWDNWVQWPKPKGSNKRAQPPICVYSRVSLIAHHCLDGSKSHGDPLAINKVIGMRAARKNKTGVVNANACAHTGDQLGQTIVRHHGSNAVWKVFFDTLKMTKPQMCCSGNKVSRLGVSEQ